MSGTYTRRGIALALVLALTALGAVAQAADDAAIDEVTIEGERAGPGLWKIRKGEHTLHVLGTLSPLPKKLVWHSNEVERVLEHSQVLVMNPGAGINAGPIQALRLYLQWRKVRTNPDDATLGRLLPPDLFDRFETLRRKYSPKDTAMLDHRPLIATAELWSAAISRSGLTSRNDIGATVKKMGKQRGLEIVDPIVRIDDPQGMLGEVASVPREAEVQCLRATIDRMESDLGSLRAQAEAWSVGDIERLRTQRTVDQEGACWSAILSSPKIAEVRRRGTAAWLDASIAALEAHPSSLAVISISNLFGADGVLAKFAARGYEVIAP